MFDGCNMATTEVIQMERKSVDKTQKYIIIKGAKQHNLKNIDLKIPRNKMVVITGVSGSGKSSLAFDTLYAEGQRRYVESLSAYARQFLGLMNKPEVDHIEGLSPAISIEQKTVSKNPRSTVATITEIYDYLRLLFAHIGHAYCYVCGDEIKSQTSQEITEQVLSYPPNTKIILLAPIVTGKKGEHKKIFERLRKEGFVRVRVDGIFRTLDEDIELDKNKKHTIEVVVDRLRVNKERESRIAESIEQALSIGEGTIIVHFPDENKDVLMSENLACPRCGISVGKLQPRNFSFNSPFGACKKCDGLGFTLQVDPDLIIPDKNLSIAEGALMGKIPKPGTWRYTYWKTLSEYFGFDLNTPIKDLPPRILNIILYGTTDKKIKFNYKNEESGTEWGWVWTPEGLVNMIARRHRETSSADQRAYYETFMREQPCEECKGQRLQKKYLSVKVNGKNIHEITELSIKEAYAFFDNLPSKLNETELKIAHEIIKEIKSRLSFLISVGLDYLTLDRRSGTLSGGESQRIRLATQIGSALVGIMYILDEPSIGLHARDRFRLIQSLRHLQEIGNTVIIVEHDEDTIRAADFVVDLGPGAGDHGGYVVATGTPQEIANHPTSITGQYLSGRKKIPIPKRRRKPKNRFLVIHGAREHNLKNITVKIPLGLFVCITGVSGSGKSTLMHEIIYKALMKHLYNSKIVPGKHDYIEGLEHIDKVVLIDQSPIGRTPRSNPATYTKVFDEIRNLFAQTKLAKIRGYKPGRFSFNVKGGRCEKCRGDGEIKIEMHFLPDVYVPCEVCKGKRYNKETLEVKYKGKNIADVLNMTVDAALEFFEDHPSITRKLTFLKETGLGYLKLGQPSPTLSGGEAQRIKITRELSKKSTGKTIYLLDEPTTGLSTHDVKSLLTVLNKLVGNGNTVIVIEHNLDVIKSADWIIDLGPEGGDDGGQIIAEGTPEDIANTPTSYTGQYLKEVLNL